MPTGDDERRRPGRLPAWCTLALAAWFVAACGAAPATVPSSSEAPDPVLRAAAEAVPRRAGGEWGPQGWPDACRLVPTLPPGLEAGRGAPGKLTDGTPLRTAKTCRWRGDGVEASLALEVVTDDVLEAWEGYLFQRSIRRSVENVGDEAFLTGTGQGDAPEDLYICTGRTIYVLRVTDASGRALPDRTAARDLLFALASPADTTLRTLPAGLPPE